MRPSHRCRRTVLPILTALLLVLPACSKSQKEGGSNGGGAAAVLQIAEAELGKILVFVLELLNAGTNWALGKNDVKIVADGLIRGEPGKRRINFKIQVNHESLKYDGPLVDIPCDDHGAPTEEGREICANRAEQIKSILRGTSGKND